MGILIDQAPDNTWRLVVREQMFLPTTEASKEVIDYLISKGIVFGVTYGSDVIIHLHDVEYVDENYEGFLKVVGELLVYKKKYGLKPRMHSEEEKIQALLQQQQIQKQAQVEAVRQQQTMEAEQPMEQPPEEVDEALQHNV